MKEKEKNISNLSQGERGIASDFNGLPVGVGKGPVWERKTRNRQEWPQIVAPKKRGRKSGCPFAIQIRREVAKRKKGGGVYPFHGWTKKGEGKRDCRTNTTY